MITVKHYPSDWETLPDVSWCVRDDAAMAQNEPPYYIGHPDYPPNYPMPAIPIEVWIAPHGVAIVRKYEWLFHRKMLKHFMGT